MTKINAVLHMKVHQNDHNRIYQKLHLHIFEQQLCHLDQRTFLPSLNCQCQCQIHTKIANMGQFATEMAIFGQFSAILAYPI